MKLLCLTMISALAFVGCTIGDGSVEETNSVRSEITHGVVDGDTHPAVVLLVMDILRPVEGKYIPVPAWRCSGTLLNATTVLTAGHCTGEPGEVAGIRAFIESDVENGGSNCPWPGDFAIEAERWASHPSYTDHAFYLHDVGVVKLGGEGVVLDDPDQYGTLPEVNSLDALRPSARTKFTAVGYGLQRITPVFYEGLRIRMRAEPHLVQINVPGMTGDFSLLLSNNASTGGTCFGDSGGPNFLGKSGESRVVAGVTSFGLNGTCGGTGGVFRMDRQDVLDFVAPWLD